MNQKKLATVIHGEKLGRTIGYPTLNLTPISVMKEEKKGVYAVEVEIHQETYLGALFYGPRLVLQEYHDVVEIYVFNFAQDVYDEKVSFSLLTFIRPPKSFASLQQLKEQLKKDCDDIRMWDIHRKDLSSTERIE